MDTPMVKTNRDSLKEMAPAGFAGSGVSMAAESLWPRLTDAERRVVCAWETISVRLDEASDKAFEVQRIVQDFAGVVKGLSRGSIYRKVAALKKEGAAGVLGSGVLRRLGMVGGTKLPVEFVAYWRGLCGLMQREKVLTVWHALMRDLIAGKVIPGYGCDWRGIWLLAHPGQAVPARCPYRADHRGGRFPGGWSYRNLKELAPERDVWAGAARGVAAMRAYLPSLPHTRVGLGLMRVITMDDVWHDCEVLFLHGHNQPTHERPVEVGALDVLTGCHICWQVWPVLRREDGSRQMVDWTVQRFIQAQIFCGIGINPQGLTELLEHGTAGMDEDEAERMNDILDRYITPPEGKRWLTVLRSSTTGAPVAKGLFQERACGNPRHKAMLESTWNLLHNEVAMALPAAVGKDRDAAPAEAEGLRREDKALMARLNEVAKANPDAIDILRQAEFHAVSFLRFVKALKAVKDAINHRTDHNLEGWEGCGFVRHIAELPGGGEMDLDAVPAGKQEETSALIKLLGAPVRLRRMSPAEAFAAERERTELVRFPAGAAMEILGEELSQEVEVGRRGTLTVRDRFSGEQLVYTGIAVSPDGKGATELTRGASYRVWANPFVRDCLLVADLQGRCIGVCKLLQAAVFGDAEGDRHNLDLWSHAAAAQQKRLKPVVAGKQARAKKVREDIETAIAAAEEHQSVMTAEKAAAQTAAFDELVRASEEKLHGAELDGVLQVQLEDFI